MKGHVGGGPGYRYPLGAGGSVKYKPFLRVLVGVLPWLWLLHVSLHIHSICEVQERLPEMPACWFGIPPGWFVGHKLESLILAQNERWRHA